MTGHPFRTFSKSQPPASLHLTQIPIRKARPLSAWHYVALCEQAFITLACMVARLS